MKIPKIREYHPAGLTIKAFHESNAFVRSIMGPVGSGKSSACCVEILRRAHMQAPGPDGIRRSRWAIIRSTYPQLKTTSLATWKAWCPLEYGKINMDSPISHKIKSGDLDLEVLFLAIEDSSDVDRLLSLELTGGYVNECSLLPKDVIDFLCSRVGRYPSKLDGGPTWWGVILDTNPPPRESWYFKLAEEQTPKGWEFFRQPSALGPNAENIENLPPGYYVNQLPGLSEDYVKVNFECEYGLLTVGKPVFPMYRESVYAKQDLAPVPDVPLLIGIDFGVHSTAVIGQCLPSGRWLIFEEFTAESPGLIRFSESLLKFVRQTFPDHEVDMCFGDPAGEARMQSDGRTGFQILNEYLPWKCQPAPTNEIGMRLEVVINTLNRNVDGIPGILISTKAQKLRKALAGQYMYRTVKMAGEETLQETPLKNEASHYADSLEYLLLGGGEHDVVLRKVQRKKRRRSGPVDGTDYDVFG